MSSATAESTSIERIDSLTEQNKKPSGDYARWRAEIVLAEKEVDKWRRRARKIVKEFRSERIEVSGIDPAMERRFNLFAANVNILQTSLINQTPQPTVNREFKDPQDDVGRIACWILERAMASYNNRNFKMSNILKQIVQDMLTAGAGSSWHTYYAETEEKQDPTSGLAYDEVISESLKDEYVYWEDLFWSPARTYDEVRWLARRTYLTRDQLIKRFGKKIGKEVSLDYSAKKSDNSVETQNKLFQQAVVYEIWDKSEKQVIWISKAYDKILDQKDDFLELDDFFPCPRPLMATVSNGRYIPVPDYYYAEDQYRELNEINTRISLLVRACRVAGVYDKASPQIKELLSNAAENTLVPVDQWAAFAERGGMKGAIDWIPLEQIVAVLEQLLKNREDIKNQIYEITGMADIIRGASKATETLGAQKIKAQYASMRIQERQKNVVEYCSAAFDIQVQLMRKHMDIEEISKLAQVQAMGEDQQLIQQALQLIKQPEFVLRCSVESDTLSDIDFQAEKEDRMEYMTTITNYLKETGQLMTTDPMLGPFLMQLLQFSLAGFKVGKKFESELDKTFQQIQSKLQQPPQPPPPDPATQKAQAEIQVMHEQSQLDAQGKQQELQFDQQKHTQDLSFEQQKHQMQLRGAHQKAQADQVATAAKMQNDQQAAQNQAVRQQQSHEVAMAQAAQKAMMPPAPGTRQ
jgi:hypothetical protein